MESTQERTNASPGHTYVSDPNSHDCRAISGILSRIGDKWSVLIIARLGEGGKRFNEIKRVVGGISQRMLTLTLRNLERDGLISRTVTPTVPPRVDYALTELGRDLLGPVNALSEWAIRHQPCIIAARAQFDAREVAETPHHERVTAG
ncbi:MAG: helix-turn-helix transcriptional regulator [Terricaulis sp.]|nr:helix-turn-helix transcriptional regulator [Terricaulis sp.]